MSQKLKDKVCIVTGATSGMGKAIAERFSEEGALLILSGRDIGRGEKLAKQLKHAQFVAGDISKAPNNKKLVEMAMGRFGKIDILSLNAGTLGLGKVTKLPIATWQQTLNTNLSALFYLSKYAIPELLKQAGSTILINASIAAYKSFPEHPAYCASKAAALALMKQMAVEYAPAIRINAICPGPVDTPLLWDSAKAFEHPANAVENAAKTTLMKRLGTPNDVAKLALFLVSEDASWITGTAVTIDGGIMNA
jgi:NAD(P)-dependent dehydrogenase (short-subunit alcohol dehydrogenase family)